MVKSHEENMKKHTITHSNNLVHAAAKAASLSLSLSGDLI